MKISIYFGADVEIGHWWVECCVWEKGKRESKGGINNNISVFLPVTIRYNTKELFFIAFLLVGGGWVGAKGLI